MKILKKRLIVVVMSLVLFVTGIFTIGGIESKKADALSPDYNERDTVYYFSDSSPILDLGKSFGNMDVIYDIQPLISSQRLAYLVYTGYFWGFDDSANTVVIVEIKTMMPDPYTLRDLFTCLQRQNCKVLFVSAYEESEYADSSFMGYVNEFMHCNKDKYARFLDYSIIDMARQNVGYTFEDFSDWPEIWDSYSWQETWADTCILLDGRLIGINDAFNNYSAKDVLAYSTFFQRMVLDMRYGLYDDDKADFEFNIYRDLWQFYTENYLDQWGYDLDYSKVNIEQLMGIWQENGFRYEDFFSYCGEEYREYYQEVIWNHFTGDGESDGIFNSFIERNTHILVHLPYSNLYWDIIHGKDSTGESTYAFNNVTELFETFENEEIRLYAMGIWLLDDDFYDFLLNAQVYLKKDEKKLPVYIWVRDPIFWEDGLEIITSDQLFSDYGLSDEYDEEYLKDTLLGLLIELIRA